MLQTTQIFHCFKWTHFSIDATKYIVTLYCYDKFEESTIILVLCTVFKNITNYLEFVYLNVDLYF